MLSNAHKTHKTFIAHISKIWKNIVKNRCYDYGVS